MRTHIEDCRMLMQCDTALVVLALFAYELRQCAFLCCFALLDSGLILLTYLLTYYDIILNIKHVLSGWKWEMFNVRVHES